MRKKMKKNEVVKEMSSPEYPAKGEARRGRPEKKPPLAPVYRRLRGYAFDPSLSGQLDTAIINENVYKVKWENGGDNGGEGLMPGPVGEYLEVVDYDPASGCFYEPVDLNDWRLLAQDGMPASE